MTKKLKLNGVNKGDKPLKAKPESEKKFQTRVVKYLNERGAYVVVHTATGYGRAGIPDILACFKGCFFGIEVKAEGKVPTKLQARELEAITAAGGWAIDLYPSKYTDLGELLDLIENLAMRNASQAKRNYRESLDAMDNSAEIELKAQAAANVPKLDDDAA